MKEVSFKTCFQELKEEDMGEDREIIQIIKSCGEN